MRNWQRVQWGKSSHHSGFGSVQRARLVGSLVQPGHQGAGVNPGVFTEEPTQPKFLEWFK